MTGLVKGHAYSVTAVEEVKLVTDERTALCAVCVVGSVVTNSNLRIYVFSYSADRLSTRTLKFVWCVSGTRGGRWSGTGPGVTSEELFFFKRIK